jgi:hypothetical protein
MDRHLLEANKPEMFYHTHDRFFPFQTMSSCKLSCIGGACGKDQSKVMCGAEQLQGSKSTGRVHRLKKLYRLVFPTVA